MVESFARGLSQQTIGGMADSSPRRKPCLPQPPRGPALCPAPGLLPRRQPLLCREDLLRGLQCLANLGAGASKWTTPEPDLAQQAEAAECERRLRTR